MIQLRALLLIALATPLLEQIVDARVMRKVSAFIPRGRIGNFPGREEQAEPHVAVGQTRATVEDKGIEVFPNVLMIRGVFDELYFNIDTDFLQLLLHERHDLGEGEGFTDEIVLD